MANKQAGAFGRMMGQNDEVSGNVLRCGVWHDSKKGLQFALVVSGYDEVMTGDADQREMALLVPGDQVRVKWHPRRGFGTIERL